MIQRVYVQGFKAFERFTLYLRGDTYLAGPNNAGKSTLIAALRVSAHLLRLAMRRNPTDTFYDGKEEVLGYAFSGSQADLEEANLRHEFRDLETRLSVRFQNGSILTAVWPPESAEQSAFFYLQHDRASINNVRQAREAFPDIGIIPILSPVDNQEEKLTPKYVRENLDGRLASRHFRNQLLMLSDEPPAENFDAFCDFAAPWVPEIEIRSLDRHLGTKNFVLDLYYRESGRRTEKEIVWAGDGIQIWLQLLLHVFRLRNREAIVLDEPDVFLHPDLQRRLVRLLESLEGQTITATHSSEVLVEAPPDAVNWVDKDRRKSIPAPQASALSGLSSVLGSQFNIRLARALRAKSVLFVEGDDAKILRQIAATIGASRIATETGIAVIPLKGFHNWEHIEPFSWMTSDLLDRSVEVFVLLDRDYRSDEQCNAIKSRLRRVNVKCHVWKRKELESYLLETELLARVASADEASVEQNLADAAADVEEHVFAQIASETLREFPRDQQTQAVKEARRRFAHIWSDCASRKWIAPPEDVLHGLNRRLEAAGYEATSFRALARRIRAAEVAPEMTAFLERVEDSLQAAGIPAGVQ